MIQDDPRSQVHAPVVSALHWIVVRALVGLAIVAAASLAPLILHLDPPIHQAAHFVIPVAWVAFAGLTALALAVRPARPGANAWDRAADVDIELVRYARRVSALMQAGWLAALAAVLVHHHLTSPREIFVTFGIIVPLTLAAWLLAVLAWNAWCRAALARAEHEADDRLRRYWSRISPPSPRR